MTPASQWLTAPPICAHVRAAWGGCLFPESSCVCEDTCMREHSMPGPPSFILVFSSKELTVQRRGYGDMLLLFCKITALLA